MKKFNYVFFIAVVFIITYSVLLICNCNKIENFYCVSIADVFNTIIALFVGVFVSFVFGITYSNKHKQLEILDLTLDMYLQDLKFLMRIIKHCCRNFDDFDIGEILHILKMAGKDLHSCLYLLEQIKFKKDIEVYRKDFKQLRYSLTETKFKNINELNSAYYTIFDCYYRIKHSITLIKFSQYE